MQLNYVTSLRDNYQGVINRKFSTSTNQNSINNMFMKPRLQGIDTITSSKGLNLIA